MDELDRLIAKRLGAFLENSGMRRQDLANAMNVMGFRWTANRVTQVVTGRRPLSLLELAGICAHGVPLSELLGEDGEIQLPDGTVRVAELWPALSGEGTWAQRAARERGIAGTSVEGWIPNEAAIKAGKRLGIAPGLVDLWAHSLWGHSLADERDRRVGSTREGETPRALQARRGHVTRALIEELKVARKRELAELMQSDQVEERQ
ncbi:helix-turn-helix domain-containing protein [Geodermatophilus sp. SYSU D01176]